MTEFRFQLRLGLVWTPARAPLHPEARAAASDTLRNFFFFNPRSSNDIMRWFNGYLRRARRPGRAAEEREKRGQIQVVRKTASLFATSTARFCCLGISVRDCVD